VLEVLVTSGGLLLQDAEFLWARTDASGHSMQLVVGDSWDSTVIGEELVFFGECHCTKWRSGVPGCERSVAEILVEPVARFDLVAWTMATDRREPQREPVVAARRWWFDPGDVNLDGEVGCADVVSFALHPYDWDLDGRAGPEDLHALLRRLGAARADLDGDGAIDLGDVAAVVLAWGCAAPATCEADLDCDGSVGVEDLLLLLELLGS
jgi:hypothetical protein